MNKKAILLLSGGLDSTTCLAIAKQQNFDVYAISFNYGQRHDIELQKAAKIARIMGAQEHRIVDIDLRNLGGSALTDDIAVPKHDNVQQLSDDIPVTYVPARNTIFLSYALAYAEIIGAFDIFIGVNAVDYSGYPDCRPEFINSFENMANLAIAACNEGDNQQKITINTPLINMTKAQIIKKGLSLNIDYDLTISCYDPSADGTACNHCDSCLLRAKGFAEQ